MLIVKSSSLKISLKLSKCTLSQSKQYQHEGGIIKQKQKKTNICLHASGNKIQNKYHKIGYYVTVGVTLWHHELFWYFESPAAIKESEKLKLLFQILALVLAFLCPLFFLRRGIQNTKKFRMSQSNTYSHRVTPSYGK